MSTAALARKIAGAKEPYPIHLLRQLARSGRPGAPPLLLHAPRTHHGWGSRRSAGAPKPAAQLLRVTSRQQAEKTRTRKAVQQKASSTPQPPPPRADQPLARPHMRTNIRALARAHMRTTIPCIFVPPSSRPTKRSRPPLTPCSILSHASTIRRHDENQSFKHLEHLTPRLSLMPVIRHAFSSGAALLGSSCRAFPTRAPSASVQQSSSLEHNALTDFRRF